MKCPKNLETNAIRKYAAKLNGERFEKYEQEDATELLLTLIPPCKVLEKLIKLQENKIFTCTVCKQVSNKLQNGNLTKIVHFNANFSIESISDMMERESKDKIEKVCYNCEQNNKKSDAMHETHESTVNNPEVYIVWPKRFIDGEKNEKDLYPSPVIKVNEKSYFLKSIVRHNGTLHEGHYKTALYMGKFWVTCNDNDIKIDYSDPTDGYLFFYENTKQVNTDFLKALSTFPNQDAPFPCSYCGKEYKVMINLQTHMVNKHSNSQMLKCPFCDSITL